MSLFGNLVDFLRNSFRDTTVCILGDPEYFGQYESE